MNNGKQGSTPEFDEFVASGEVEVGESNLASQESDEPKKPAAKRGPPKPAKVDPKPEVDDTDEADDDGEIDEADDDGEIDEGDDGEEEQPRKKAQRKPSDRIRELTRKLRDRERYVETLVTRLDTIEKSLLPNNNVNGNLEREEEPAPDPSDTAKYPLGHLDDRYIEDKLSWLAEKKAAEKADAVLRRQQENEQNQAFEQQQRDLLEKVDALASRGSEFLEDFTETVVETGIKGKWDLTQITFEAAYEAENGAQILYELSQDKKEAARVAKLSPLQQLKFVQDRDTEISKGKSPRRIPQAGDPPKYTARGANSRVQINPATDNLDDFEKAWEAEAKKARR